ncbi:ferredoxin--NADP reductase [soil metagenome]
MSALRNETVLSVHHWTDELFSFRTTRDKGFRFASGQFTMIGLRIKGKPLLRAYSIASAHYDEALEFFSIKVPDGKLTSRLKDLAPGDAVLVGAKATGTLLLDSLTPGRNLYLLGTGTGLAPFLSIVRDPEVYERFEKVILVHGCRHVRDLAYRSKLADELPADEILGDAVRDKLVYYPTVTREPFKYRGRISHLIENGTLARDVGLPPIARETDRFMLCGSVQMLADLRTILQDADLTEGSTTVPGEFVVEKAFVE